MLTLEYQYIIFVPQTATEIKTIFFPFRSITLGIQKFNEKEKKGQNSFIIWISSNCNIHTKYTLHNKIQIEEQICPTIFCQNCL